MVNTTTSSNIQAAAQNLAKSAGKDATKYRGLLGLFTAGAAIVTGMMIKDCFQGSSVKREQLKDENNEARDYRNAQWGWGHWSGQPGMDNMAHNWYQFLQYGPYNLRQTFQNWGVNINSFFSDVLWPNLIPLGVTVAGLYGTLGAKAVHKPFNAVKNWLFSGPISQPLKDAARFVGYGAWKGVSTVVGGGFKWCTKSCTHIGIATGALFLGAYFLKRFNDASGHDGQDSFFRDLWTKEPVE